MRAATLAWFARHELRLAFRDLLAMLVRRRRGHITRVVLGLCIVELILHGVAYAIIAPSAHRIMDADRVSMVAIGASMGLMWLLFLSQAMESTTRGFYARGDLDLLLSSPLPASSIFAIRIGAIAASTALTAMLIAGPAIDILALLGGPRFLCGYGVLFAFGISAAAVAVMLTAAMFRTLGARRTRGLAQIIAALIGAGFVVGLQAAAVVEHDSLSRFDVLLSSPWMSFLPGPGSSLWLPVRAALGNGQALALVMASAVALLGLAIVLTADAYARSVAQVAAAPAGRSRVSARRLPRQARSQASALRRKELLLLWRDPWLISQSFMQILYLLPPALMLWHSYGSGAGHLVILVPVIVMAAGQLSGGLAWLAISGEDAPDLIGTAPIARNAVLRAKIEAVGLAITVPIAPLLIAMALAAPAIAAASLLGVATAAAGASAVQYVFRTKGRRSNFRRRHTASRLATFAEAFVSISVAAAAGLAAAGAWLALVPLAVTLVAILAMTSLTTVS